MARQVIDTSGTTDTLSAGFGKVNANFTELYTGAETVAATAKTTPVDADVMPIQDSAASNAKKKVTWANIKATLKSYFDTLYSLAVTTPRVYYVTSSGDDTTGNGSLAKPFLTMYKAMQVGEAAAVNYAIQFGVGSFSETGMQVAPTYLKTMFGAGDSLTTLALSTAPTGGDSDYGASGLTLTLELRDLTISVTNSGNNGDVAGGAGGTVDFRGRFTTGALTLTSGQTAASYSGDGGTIILSGARVVGNIEYQGSTGGLLRLYGCDLRAAPSLNGTGPLESGNCAWVSSVPGTDKGGNSVW